MGDGVQVAWEQVCLRCCRACPVGCGRQGVPQPNGEGGGEGGRCLASPLPLPPLSESSLNTISVMSQHCLRTVSELSQSTASVPQYCPSTVSVLSQYRLSTLSTQHIPEAVRMPPGSRPDAVQNRAVVAVRWNFEAGLLFKSFLHISEHYLHILTTR